MNYEIAQDNLELAQKTTHWVESKFKQYQSKILQLPAGNTPIPIYEYWQKTKPSFLQHLSLHPVDDVITGLKKGVFEKFFKQYLPDFQIKPLTEKPVQPDLVILGIGTNGHVAFHEPEIHPTMNYSCVRLSAETCKNLQLEPNTWGISYGIAHFLKCKSILLIAYGTSKKSIVEKLRHPKGPAQLPVEFLLQHRDITLLSD